MRFCYLSTSSMTALRMSEPGGGTRRDCRAPKAGRCGVPHACVTQGGQECFSSLLRVPENSTTKR
ncbi:hypothetical protein LEMLEM_LOCUS15832, partial [Lemmus lemmus]